MNIDYPYRFDSRGRTSLTTQPDHIQDMIKQFLFTSPGERVNRPDFGAGLLRRVFEPNRAEMGAVLEVTIKSGLQRWMDDLIEVYDLEILTQESTIQVVVQYKVRRTDEMRRQEILYTVMVQS